MGNLDELYKSSLNRIFEMMKLRGLTQKEFAKRLGVSSQTITDWKNGKSLSFMEGRYMVEMAKILDSNTEYLMFGDGPKEAKDKLPYKGWNEPDDFGRMFLTREEIGLIQAFRNADGRTQAIVKLALDPFKEKGSASHVG